LRVAAGLTPVADVGAVLDAARAADDEGLDAVALWDHYQSGRPEWAYVAGWSAWGAIATATRRVGLVPMVVNQLHHDLGRIAKEVATLAALSGGRFELGIGAGDWPESFAAWGQSFPAATDRIDRLVESIEALRLLWTGEPTTFDGLHVQLEGATVTPSPSTQPRVVIGAGPSRRLAIRAARVADEVNVYPSRGLVEAVRAAAADSGRAVDVSLHADWSWDAWPADPVAALEALSATAADRVFIAVGAADMPARVRQLARAARDRGIIDG
jgi:alkanesulfonate monooxygenase SsuD/methylene tetrahydromethanopterin reductase-like flavin-dependent oxidoreductase (luciferase family)